LVNSHRYFGGSCLNFQGL